MVNDYFHDDAPPPRKPLQRKSGLKRDSSLLRSTTPTKRKAISPASPEQREKVRDRMCVFCAGDGPCDPAHLTPRSQGGCDSADCVVPLCRSCHRFFDEGQLDLESVLALRQFSVERSHMAGHMSLQACIRRLRGYKDAA